MGRWKETFAPRLAAACFFDVIFVELCRRGDRRNLRVIAKRRNVCEREKKKKKKS